MVQLATFHLPAVSPSHPRCSDSHHIQWLEGPNAARAKHVLGGSAAPWISLDDLVALSKDPTKTKEALNFQSLTLKLNPFAGTSELRTNIAELYSKAVLPEHVITGAGTTGVNCTAFLSLLQAGDHVICQYPTYPQLLALPKSMCELSHWKLDPGKGWAGDLEELRALIRPSTKMIILNNPNNP